MIKKCVITLCLLATTSVMAKPLVVSDAGIEMFTQGAKDYVSSATKANISPYSFFFMGVMEGVTYPLSDTICIPKGVTNRDVGRTIAYTTLLSNADLTAYRSPASLATKLAEMSYPCKGAK